MRLAKENKADIFATDVAISAIMSGAKSLFSWDVKIKKFQGKIFIDKRDEPNMLNMLTVNETAHIDFQPIDDESVNGIRQLMQEAMDVHHQVLYQSYDKSKKNKGKAIELEEEDPFLEDEDQVAAKFGYIYKVWKFGKKRICIRCTVHGYIMGKGGEEEKDYVYQNVYSMLEFEGSKQNWIKEIDNSMAKILSKEVQNNSCKITRWIIQSILADVSKVKFIFVGRKNKEDNKRHHALGTYSLDTEQFAK
mmetsp:Transcript_4555/g.4288  ORF Transcript_4555/g.4288 Transcript_4555/m.4288 type:complete len:249 (-) Transcript_4555:204-950(-)